MKLVIIAVSAVAIISTIGTIVIGSRQFDGLVTEHPYESGLAWDEMNKNRERLGWKVILGEGGFKTGGNDLHLEVRDRAGNLIPDARVRLTVRRPSTSAHDRTYEDMEKDGRGGYRTRADLPLAGMWDIDADIRKGNEQCRFRFRITAAK